MAIVHRGSRSKVFNGLIARSAGSCGLTSEFEVTTSAGERTDAVAKLQNMSPMLRDIMTRNPDLIVEVSYTIDGFREKRITGKRGRLYWEPGSQRKDDWLRTKFAANVSMRDNVKRSKLQLQELSAGQLMCEVTFARGCFAAFQSDYPTLRDWKLTFGRRTSAWGVTMYREKVIRLSAITLIACRQRIFDCIAHECAHALCPGCSHNDKWRNTALELGSSGNRCGFGVDCRTSARTCGAKAWRALRTLGVI